MRIFQDMGRLLQERWLKVQHSEEAFPDIAAEVLRELAPHQEFKTLEPLEWLYGTRDFPKQLTTRPGFGQPALTVFSDSRLLIDLYYWVDGTTDIHQHGFCGAFQVLQGSSIHGHYRWHERHKVNSRVAFGDMELLSVTGLRTGDIHRILGGDKYIHSLFHLERPSVTCVVRTLHSPEGGYQYSYKKPHLAYYPGVEDAHTSKVLQSLSLLAELSPPERTRLIRGLIERSDILTCFFVFERLLQLHKKLEALDPYWDVAVRTHGALAEELRPVFKEYMRQALLIDRRGQVKDPEHRYFLALLLNVERGEHIQQLVRQRFPDRDPVDLIMKWVTALTQPAEGGARSRDSLGVPLDESALIVFRELLHSRGHAEVMARLKETFDDDEVDGQSDDIAALAASLRESTLFRPLFRG
ncbi:hypothetical protein D7Y21_36985 [Corallococcus sp. AB045]|uniref:hypothetical protein n=1 Tax=Corallococcus sp. AB045 TaxID=2316719 RepID=UPI000ED43D3C|nr:hypothetical protein [Corallococcus sp. AB045]RKH77648.1 hypothetical protein D7Y21_36985 [Corallococcus sp. AB045]